MKKPNDFLNRAGRVVAGINVLFNLGTAPKPPDLQAPARSQELHSQWAKNEKTNVLPSWRNRSRELGHQLREPVSGEYRPREDSSAKQPIARIDNVAKARDSHEQALSQQPGRDASRRTQSRDGQSHARESGGRQTGASRGRDGQSR